MILKNSISILSLIITIGTYCAQDSIVYWKRYVAIDWSLGISLNNPNYYNYKRTPINGEGLSINIGLLKRYYTPFLNFGVEGETDMSYFSSSGYSMVPLRLGTFIYKSEQLESTIATGFAWNPDGNNASSSLLRLVFKPRKWFGVGIQCKHK
jgi:hypothetical protein